MCCVGLNQYLSCVRVCVCVYVCERERGKARKGERLCGLVHLCVWMDEED